MKSIVQLLNVLVKKQRDNNYYEAYWAFDLHGVIIQPNKIPGSTEMIFYPHAEETLKLLSNRDDIRLIIFSSSYPNEMHSYINEFNKRGINFHYVNENPEINQKHYGYYNDKWYFDILFEDRCGFEPDTDWKEMRMYLLYDLNEPKVDVKYKRKDIIFVDDIPITLKDDLMKVKHITMTDIMELKCISKYRMHSILAGIATTQRPIYDEIMKKINIFRNEET